MDVKIEKSQMDKLKSFKNKSTQMRYLESLGISRGQISRELTKIYKKEVRYQFVKGVLDRTVKNPKESFK